jgi:hypothetical protein
MRKSLYVVLALLAAAVAAPIPALLERRRKRCQAAAARPEVEAVLDEMIRIVSEWKGPLEKLVATNDARQVNETVLKREIMLNLGKDWYALDATVRMTGRDAGQMAVGVSRRLGDKVTHLYWPDAVGRAPGEAWVVDRIERLDALVGRTNHPDAVIPVVVCPEDDDEDGGGGGFRTN